MAGTAPQPEVTMRARRRSFGVLVRQAGAPEPLGIGPIRGIYAEKASVKGRTAPAAVRCLAEAKGA